MLAAPSPAISTISAYWSPPRGSWKPARQSLHGTSQNHPPAAGKLPPLLAGLNRPAARSRSAPAPGAPDRWLRGSERAPAPTQPGAPPTDAAHRRSVNIDPGADPQRRSGVAKRHVRGSNSANSASSCGSICVRGWRGLRSIWSTRKVITPPITGCSTPGINASNPRPKPDFFAILTLPLFTYEVDLRFAVKTSKISKFRKSLRNLFRNIYAICR